jgi:S-adenosylmethionine decarboxylase
MSGPGSPFFEGTEKKFELVVDPGLPSFLERGHTYWTAVARSAGADVLSWISNERCCAYLLSESSLFVFDHRVVMMTCGCSALHNAVLKILEDLPAEKVRTLVYKRKHEIFPHDQPTSFFDDVKVLSRELPGRAYQFGNEDEHHLYVFHLNRQRGVGPAGTSVEMLMHGLGDGVGDDFRLSGRRTASRVRAATGIDRILPGFELDDHLFVPNGYSLNAIRGEEYYAVHVTPEEACSYASFETNHRFHDDLEPTVSRLLRTFRPRSYDLVVYGDDPGVVEPDDYRLRSHVAQALDPGLRVRFRSFYRPEPTVVAAIELPVG